MAFTPIEGGLDWQAAAFVNEFFNAFNERVPGLDPPTGGTHADNALLDLVEAGDDIQLASLWATLQQRIEDQFDAVSVVPTGVFNYAMRWLVPYDIADGGSLEEAPEQLDFLEFCEQSSDMADLGWRRATEWPTDWTDLEDEAYSFGRMEAGDIIGPWIFVDLQTALDAMRVRYVTTDALGKGERILITDDIGDNYDDLVDAFDAADPEDYVGHPQATHLESGSLSVQALERRMVKYGLYENLTAANADLMEITDWALGANESDTVDYYVMITEPATTVAVYDDNDDDWQEAVYNKVASSLIGAQSGDIGALTPAPVENTASGYPSAGTGYIAGDSFHFIRFDFEWVK